MRHRWNTQTKRLAYPPPSLRPESSAKKKVDLTRSLLCEMVNDFSPFLFISTLLVEGMGTKMEMEMERRHPHGTLLPVQIIWFMKKYCPYPQRHNPSSPITSTTTPESNQLSDFRY